MSDSVSHEMQSFPFSTCTGIEPDAAEVFLKTEDDGSSDRDSILVGEAEGAAAAVKDEPDVQQELPNMPAGFGSAILIPSQIIPPNTFNLFTGIHFERFSIPIHDFRRESRFFRMNTSITSVELRYEDPEAVRLIKQWFDGHLGKPPVTKRARDVYMAAAKIAAELTLGECESQLLVIVHKITSVLAGLISDQLDADAILPADMIRDIIEMEMAGYMVRSTHVGGDEI